MSLEYEPSSELLHISAKQFFLSAGDKAAALCVLVEMVEHGGAAAAPLAANIVAACLTYAQVFKPPWRQLKGKSLFNLPQMPPDFCGIGMGVD